MYQNNLFFLKNSFLISTRQNNSKTQKKKKKIEAKKKKNQNFMKLLLHCCPKRVIEIRIARVSIFPGEELVVFKTGKLHKKTKCKAFNTPLAPVNCVIFYVMSGWKIIYRRVL
jgi:hypothetical protein